MSDKPVMRVERQCFETLEDVMEAIKSSGFWPTTYISTPSPELPLHWHDDDVEGYLLKGETYVLNEKGERVDLGPGDKLVIPAGALHAEGKVTDEIVYVVSTRAASPSITFSACLTRIPIRRFSSWNWTRSSRVS